MRLHVYFAILVTTAYANAAEEHKERIGKLLPIFQVVRFPNDMCTGTTRNGTCFTAEECSAIGGTNEGSCASGFGVCCISALACGGTTSTNNSYLVQSAVTTLTSPCTYSVCPCSTDICRIRYDFTTNVLATQQLGAASDGGTLTDNGAIGDCNDDSMYIANPGAFGTPVICGTNSGQHMILDSAGTQCQQVNFHIGSSTTTSRSWDIYITQYTCGQEETVGSPGCLQWFTGTSGTIRNYGYDSVVQTNAAQTQAATTHLSNQHYAACFRREKGYCSICYIPSISIAVETSFGLSTADADNAMGKAVTDSYCSTDYLVIPNGVLAIAVITTPAQNKASRYCGRYLNTDTGADANVSICSRIYPFRLEVRFDDNEVCTATGTHLCETDTEPGGIIGFKLNFVQNLC